MSKANEPVATVVNGHTFTIDVRYVLKDSRILGKGSFGVVCTAFDSIRKIDMAIKRIRPYANDEWDARHTLREIRLLKLLGNHPNVITLYELSLFEPKTELYMMMEVMDCDLHRVIQSKQPLSEKHHKCFIKQILEGIKAMHAIGVFHRDLKPGNILVSKDCQLRITDFGLARFMDDITRKGNNSENPMTQYVVTRWYRPPELLLCPDRPYSEAIDLWSIGCILAELLRRKPLFPGKSHSNQVSLIFEVLGFNVINELGFPVSEEASTYLTKRCKFRKQPFVKVFPDASHEAVQMLESLLTVNPDMRPNAQEALSFPFLQDAEVLHDYTKTYLSKPNADFFEFEQEKYSAAMLKSMIEEEVHSSSATAYHNQSTSSLQSNQERSLQSSPSHETSTNASPSTVTTPSNAATKSSQAISNDGTAVKTMKSLNPFAANNTANDSSQPPKKAGVAGVRRLSNANITEGEDGPESQQPTQRYTRNDPLLPVMKDTANPFRNQTTNGQSTSSTSTVSKTFTDRSQSTYTLSAQQNQEKNADRMQLRSKSYDQAVADSKVIGRTEDLYDQEYDAEIGLEESEDIGDEKDTYNEAIDFKTLQKQRHDAKNEDKPSRYLSVDSDEMVMPMKALTNRGGNILAAVRQEAAMIVPLTSAKSTRRGGPKTPSPQKMDSILQKDLNNKKRFFIQEMMKGGKNGSSVANNGNAQQIKSTQSTPKYQNTSRSNSGSDVLTGRSDGGGYGANLNNSSSNAARSMGQRPTFPQPNAKYMESSYLKGVQRTGPSVQSLQPNFPALLGSKYGQHNANNSTYPPPSSEGLVESNSVVDGLSDAMSISSVKSSGKVSGAPKPSLISQIQVTYQNISSRIGSGNRNNSNASKAVNGNPRPSVGGTSNVNGPAPQSRSSAMINNGNNIIGNDREMYNRNNAAWQNQYP